MKSLTELYCHPLPEGSAALSTVEIAAFLPQIPNWQVLPHDEAISCTFHFKNYYETMAFVNAIAWIAHSEDHHPDLKINYDRCTISYNTHTVKGLSENDFICAAKINHLLQK